MPTIIQSLASEMDSRIRHTIDRRTAFMVRQLNYLKEHGDRRLADAERVGWSVRRLEVVCWLNSFFQLVVSPLAASAVSNLPLDLGGTTPIQYGSITFDRARRAAIRLMHRDFANACRASEIDSGMLTAHRADDLVYLISQRISSDE